MNSGKLSADELNLLARFPYENPNPVFRVNSGGVIDFANKSAKPFLDSVGIGIGGRIPDRWDESVLDAKRTGEARELEISAKDKYFSLTFTPVENKDFTYVYCLDITSRKKAEEALKKSEEILVKAQSIAHVGSWELEISSGDVAWSDEAYVIFGYTAKEVKATYRLFMESIYPDDRQKVQDAIDNAIKGGGQYKLVHRLARLDGNVATVFAQGQIYCDDGGKPERLIGIVHDITSQKASEDQFKLADKVFEKALEGVMITDANASILTVNPSFTRITGFPKEEVIGKKPNILRSDRHPRKFYEIMWKDLITTGSWSGEIWNRRKNGEAYPELLSITAVNDDFGNVEKYIAVFHDMSEVKKSQQELKYRTNYDALTGLPNRTLLMDRLAQSIAFGKENDASFALVIVGIDNFRKINESMGHAAGDILLQEAGKRISERLRGVDTVSRFGGDEFALILEDVHNLGHAANVARKLIEVFEKPFSIGADKVHMTASLGITLFPADGERAEDLLQNSDIAMARAKSEGKNRYQFFASEMNELAIHKMNIEKDLRIALDENQLMVHYQPKLDIKSGKISGVESLVRWNHPTVGVMYPVSFMQVAEDTGLIVRIGDDVLRSSCVTGKSWIDSGLGPIMMASNLSARQFRGPNIAQKIKEILNETEFPPERLELEITESMVMHDVDSAISILAKLKDMGISISIDDFGTGYSSFAYLKKFPVDTLKIDKVFVDDIARSKDEAKIIMAIISMGHSLNLKVVAEGVETKEQYELLREAGCDMIQGYYLSKPIPAADMKALLSGRKKVHVD
ncbi:MAG: EAL domain-containing protein [Nitrospinota bacterium]|nr:EAL domain-containing protein [Nitrospinota bacterium]